MLFSPFVLLRTFYCMRTSIKVVIKSVYVNQAGAIEDHERDGEVTLFSTKTSVIAIDSLIKRRILKIIADGEISFDEIVSLTGKAKSTISVHLRDLETAGLISSRPDPVDHRKRLISMNSEPIGQLTNADRKTAQKHIHEEEGTLPFTEGDIASFFSYTLRVFRTEAMNLGMNIDPILKRSGLRIGRALAPLVADETVAGKVSKMSAFWQSYGLGTITLVSEHPLTLRVEGCFECQDLPITGHGSCAFDIGVLSSLFSEEFMQNPQVVEVECYSTGFDHCTFIITRGDHPEFNTVA
ncbi:4-vinyl reductase [Methanospirillum lacunae]|uniref:4-vinyl reductase n=2 Tax=Methanospirillum lacunae TaxID=668570 RepID=A0A2V2NGH6_9EURY|nr:4-vinyl reductase [Methanospirillum lacunae]